MRHVRQSVDRAMLPAYRRIIELYTPYLLVRCARYTNGRRQAQQIGVYTLITTCIVVDRMEQGEGLGKVMDIMAGVVGPDVVSGGRGEVWRGGYDEPLIVDPGMRKIARALNALKRPWREVLVLHHVAGMEPNDLARLLQRPRAETVAKISRAEKLLAQRLEGRGDEGRGARGPDVPALLTEFAAALDGGWMQEVADGALDYLAQCARRDRRPHPCWMNQWKVRSGP